MNDLKQGVIGAYYSVRNSWPVWYGILNGDARRKFRQHKPQLNPVQGAVLSDLRRDGIAFSSLDALFPGEQMLKKLKAFMDERGQMQDAQIRKKSFLRPYWDEKDAFGLDNPFFAMSLRSEILDVVNSYDSMWRRFNYMHLTETVPVGDAEAVQSQRWHRDHEEKRMVKVFLYLNDVDDNAGPFTYVKGSQFGSPRYGSLFPQKPPRGVYPPQGEVEKNVAASDIIAATGAAGSVIFCDTAGLHRGGHAKSKSRFMFTAFYPSTYWGEPTLFKLKDSVRSAELSPAAKFALYLDR